MRRSLSGSARFSADGIAAGGFDNVSLSGRSGVVFDGNVNLKAAQSIAFYQGALSDTDPNASVTISAPYVLLGGATAVDTSQVPAGFYTSLGVYSQQTSTGKLTVSADLIDIQNDVRFGERGTATLSNGSIVNYDYAGFAEEDFISRGDIRFAAPTPTISGSGTMTTLYTPAAIWSSPPNSFIPTTGATVRIAAGSPTSISAGHCRQPASSPSKASMA